MVPRTEGWINLKVNLKKKNLLTDHSLKPKQIHSEVSSCWKKLKPTMTTSGWYRNDWLKRNSNSFARMMNYARTRQSKHCTHKQTRVIPWKLYYSGDKVPAKTYLESWVVTRVLTLWINELCTLFTFPFSTPVNVFRRLSDEKTDNVSSPTILQAVLWRDAE